MKYLGLLLFFLFNTLNAEYYSYHRNVLRNMGLRLLIACNYRRHKNAVQIFNHKYQETIIQIQQDTRNKCIELSSQYYSLTDEDRYLIEKMIDLIL